MPDYDVVIDKSVDTFLSDTGYLNVPWTSSKLFVSEGATLSQSPLDSATFLYIVDLIIGENSTGTAILKTGYLSITKPDFDLILVTAGSPVPDDTVFPAGPDLTLVTLTQNTGVLEGRSVVRLEWTVPTFNDPFTQIVCVATGGTQTADLTFDPIVSDSEKIFEVLSPTSFTTKTTDPFTKDQDVLQVLDSLPYVAGDIIEVNDGINRGFYEISSVGAGELTVTSRCGVVAGFNASADVVKVNVSVKTRGTDYTINYGIGQLTLISGHFTNGNTVASIYAPTLTDLNHLELYRVYGDHALPPRAGYSKVTKEDLTLYGAVVVDDNLDKYAMSYVETLPPSQNGRTWTYYLLAIDSSTYSNSSWASTVMVETVPSIPKSISARVGNAKVLLNWHPVTGGSDQNTDGFNVYRVQGPTFVESACIKVNTGLVNKTLAEFEDGSENVINRRPSGEVPYPINGYVYSYKIEAEDTLTEWDVGTKNQDSETGVANYTASKTP
jgi:hypothetical protein